MQVSFEKHKIFLYKEDFEKFMEGMQEVINYIKDSKQKSEEKGSDVVEAATGEAVASEELLTSDIKLDIEF